MLETIKKMRNIIILALIPLGVLMLTFKKGREIRHFLFDIHKSFGLLFFVLLLAIITYNIAFKKTNRKSPLGWAMLFFSFALPISGILIVCFEGYTLPFFGLFSIKIPTYPNHDWYLFTEDIHKYLSIVLISVICFVFYKTGAKNVNK